MATPTPILNLDIFDGSVVRIDGLEFPLLSADLVPPIDGHRLMKYGRRLDALGSRPELTPEEEAELTELPDKMCRLILVAPPDVLAALTDRQRTAIISTFLRGPLSQVPVESQPPAAPSPSSTGANTSPDSSGSTVEAP